MTKSAIAICSIIASIFLLGCSNTAEETFMNGMYEYAHIIVENNGNCEVTAKKLNSFTDWNGEKMGNALAEMVKNASKQVSDNSARSPLQLIADELEYFLSPEELEIARHPACAEDEKVKAAQAHLGEILMKPVFKEMAGDVGEALRQKEEENK